MVLYGPRHWQAVSDATPGPIARGNTPLTIPILATKQSWVLIIEFLVFLEAELLMEGLRRLAVKTGKTGETPLSTQRFLRRDADGGGGGAARPSAALGAFGARGTSAHHAPPSSCPLAVTRVRVCSLAAVLPVRGPSGFGRSGHWQRRRAGAFGARWRLHWHASVSSRAVPSRCDAPG